MNKLLLVFCSSLLFYSCKKPMKECTPEDNNFIKYIHIAHTRTNNDSIMDPVAQQLDFSEYEMLWLGGDLLWLTSASEYYMNTVNEIFNIESENTLWAVGNHDYTNTDLVEEYTNRPLFYTYHKNGITFIVLDTQDDYSNISGEQLELLTSVTDTIQNSSHLILLHHKLIWMYGEENLEPIINATSNGEFGSCFYCLNPNNFYNEVYGELLEVKSRNIDVICIGGDIGLQTKEFEYITEDGIQFLASGIKTGESTNSALIFHHDLENRNLFWEFKLLIDL